ncbi:hypothetical protein [Erythrobacter sp. R86502]|uniref:hypothetical protein n=1 Tax=Erythrobacter sp. R86502 TaxID=3093846 RepID=UPI0036D3A78E
MRDLIIRLDQKVSDGFDNINSKQDLAALRADGHEDRIRRLEDTTNNRNQYIPRFEAVEAKVAVHEGRFNQLDGAGKGANLFGKVATAALGALAAVLAMLGLQVSTTPKNQVHNTTVVEQPTKSAPK